MSDLAGIKKNIAFLNWVAAIAVGAIVSLYFILSAQVDQRFNRADDKVTGVAGQVSDLRVAVAGQSADIKAVLVKLDDEPKAGRRAKPAK